MTLSVAPGEVLALLGPSGAGKTALGRVVAAEAQPTQGNVRIYGHDVQRQRNMARRLVALAPRAEAIEDALGPLDNLAAASREAGLVPEQAAALAAELVSTFGLRDFAKTPAGQLPGGTRQLLGLALGLAGAPYVVVMDNPAAGLDQPGRGILAEAVRTLAQGGVSVLLATSDIDQAQSLADRIVLLDRGRVMGHGTPVELRAAIGHQNRLVIGAVVGSDLPVIERTLAGLGLADVASNRTRCQVTARLDGGPDALAQLIFRLKVMGLGPIEIGLRGPTLGDAIALLKAAS
ncbi:MAG: ABC transporter ATP-binding protein [Bifidobacteriaceae bacterium]|nr:ABC transporter ATP-binding protein [Bifidobacteriaceae bacterium]